MDSVHQIVPFILYNRIILLKEGATLSFCAAVADNLEINICRFMFVRSPNCIVFVLFAMTTFL